MEKKNKKWVYKTSSRTILADLYTPVGVYMHLRDIYPQSVLMESSDYHDANNSRSFIGINPIASVAISHGESILALIPLPLWLFLMARASCFSPTVPSKGTS